MGNTVAGKDTGLPACPERQPQLYILRHHLSPADVNYEVFKDACTDLPLPSLKGVMQCLTSFKMPDYMPDKKDGSGTGVCEVEHKHPMAGEAGVRRTPLTVHVKAGNRMKRGKGHSQV